MIETEQFSWRSARFEPHSETESRTNSGDTSTLTSTGFVHPVRRPSNQNTRRNLHLVDHHGGHDVVAQSFAGLSWELSWHSVLCHSP